MIEDKKIIYMIKNKKNFNSKKKDSNITKVKNRISMIKRRISHKTFKEVLITINNDRDELPNYLLSV